MFVRWSIALQVRVKSRGEF